MSKKEIFHWLMTQAYQVSAQNFIDYIATYPLDSFAQYELLHITHLLRLFCRDDLVLIIYGVTKLPADPKVISKVHLAILKKLYAFIIANPAVHAKMDFTKWPGSINDFSSESNNGCFQ